MATGVFNIAKGEVNAYQTRVANNDPANSALIIVLLQSAEADDTLNNYDDLATLLAAPGNTEATFTNYARKTLTDADISDPTVDDTANTKSSDFPDQSWPAAGGVANNDLEKLIVCYDPDSTSGDDSTLVPLTYHDFVATTDGTELIAQVNAAGYFRAS